MSSIFEQALEYVGYKEPVIEGLFMSREEKEHYQQLENQFRSKLERVWPKIKKEVIEKSVNEVKSKTKHKLLWDIDYDDDNENHFYGGKSMTIKIFKDDWYPNEWVENHNPEAVKAFNAIINKIKQNFNIFKYFSKDEINSMKIYTDVSVEECNYIDVTIASRGPYG